MTKQEQKQLLLLIGAFLLLVYLAFSGWISLDIENDSMIIRRHNWPFHNNVVFQRPLFQINEVVLEKNIYLKQGKGGLASSDGVFLSRVLDRLYMISFLMQIFCLKRFKKV